MDNNLEQLKKDFNKIKDIRHKITILFGTLESHMRKLKETHSMFIKSNKDNTFVFGLDSLQFQSKIIDIEYDDMKRLFLAINNRIYCEYYKLYKIIAEYVKYNIVEKKALDLIRLTNNFPVYKDLEPFKQYDFEIIQEMHEHIILILYAINEYIENKQNELNGYKKQQSIGLNINNFVTTFKFGINTTKEKFELFISYIEFFHGLHTKYLKRFAMKMNLFFSQITNDIRFEDAPTTSESKKNEIIDTIKEEHIDNKLIDQLTNVIQGNENENESDESISIPNKGIDKKSESNSSLDSLDSKKSLKDLFKKNVKKVINGFRAFGPKNFTQMDDNRLKLNIIEKPNEMILETTHKPIMIDELKNVLAAKKQENSPMVEEKKSISLNALINPLSEEDNQELVNILNQNPDFEELNNLCESLISPTNKNNSSYELEKKIRELDIFENDLYNNDVSLLNQQNINNISNFEIKQIQEEQIETNIQEEKSLSNLTMDSFEHSSTIETTPTNQTQIQTETQSNKKKKKKKKNKK